MPRTKRKAVARINVRIPKPIIDEADRIVRQSGLYINRQQFVESAIRERIEENRLLGKIGGDFVANIKDWILVHAVINTAKEKAMPANHLDPEQFERDVRRNLEEKAKQKGKRITTEQLDELTKYLSEQHKEILEGLNSLGKP